MDLDRPRQWVWLSFTLNIFAAFFCLFAYSLLVETFCSVCRLGYGSGNKALTKWNSPLSDCGLRKADVKCHQALTGSF